MRAAFPSMRPACVATLLATLLLAGNAVLAQPPVPYPPVPPPRAERVPPPPPGARMMWQPGHWQWDGGRGYAWVPGRYVEAMPRYRHWARGRWAWGNGGWIWVPGHWQ